MGSMRHWQPVVATYRIASNTSRRYVVRGRPVLLSRGTRGVISAPSASVKSFAYLSPSRACWRRVSSVQAMGGSVQICNQTEPQPAELNQLVLNRALRCTSFLFMPLFASLLGQSMPRPASFCPSSVRALRIVKANPVIADPFCLKAIGDFMQIDGRLF